MDVKSFEEAIRSKSLGRSIYLLAGREDFLKERAIKKLLTAYIPPDEQSENVLRLDGSAAGPADILGFLNRFSFGESKRVLLLHSAEGFSAAERREVADKLAEHPLPEDVLLLLSTRDSAAAGDWEKKLGSSCFRVDFWPPFENLLPAWVTSEGKELGLQLLPGAADALLDLIGNDLGVLVQELEKMSFQLGRDGKVTPGFIETNVRYLRQDSVFDLVEHMGFRRLPAVMRSLETLLQGGENPYRLWIMIQKSLREFRMLHDLRLDRPDLVQEAYDQLKALARLHGKTDFRANQERKRLTTLIQETARNWPPGLLDFLPLDQAGTIKNLVPAVNFTRDELVRVWPHLEETDLKLKSTLPNPRALLQGFLAGLLSGRPAKTV
jgi:DNA polymerase-3 subunit delta